MPPMPNLANGERHGAPVKLSQVRGRSSERQLNRCTKDRTLNTTRATGREVRAPRISDRVNAAVPMFFSALALLPVVEPFL